MFNDISNIFKVSITLEEVLINLLVALICGILISYFYRKTYRGPGFLNSFVNSIIILSMITAIVIMVIGNNLARAFGLVGAMSIIRFRTAVKETQDIVFIFFSLAIGMAAGVGLHHLAIGGTLFIGLISMVLFRSNLLDSGAKEFLLQFNLSLENDEQESRYLKVMDTHCKRYRTVNARSLGENGDLELSYYVTLKKTNKSSAFVRELKQQTGISHVNLFFDEEHF